MHILEQLGVALGLATLAGVNLYLTVLITGLAVRFDLLHLASQYQQLEVLGHPVVLLVAGVLYAVEFVADKVPWVDSLWDSVHTVIRPVGGVLLGLQALGDMPTYVQVAAGLIAGGAALTTHGAKAGTRLLVNHSPEPVTNVALSVGEDVAVAGGTALALLHPVIGLAIFAVVLGSIWMVFPRIWRGIRATCWLMWNKLKMPGRRQPLTEPVDLPCELSEDLRNMLVLRADLKEDEVRATVRCLSGRSRGIKGFSPNLDGVLVLTTRTDRVFFAASKGLSDCVFPIPLTGGAVTVESKFLSENLLVEAGGARAVLRFARGQGPVIETVALRLNEMLKAAVEPAPSHAETAEASVAGTPLQAPEEERSRDADSGPGGLLPLPSPG